jgi:hypothetical protein
MPGAKYLIEAICPDCMGSGITHCCDGLREQPEPHSKDCIYRPINIHGEEDNSNDHGC